LEARRRHTDPQGPALTRTQPPAERIALYVYGSPLAGLTELTSLEIRHCQDLDGMPALDTGPTGDRFIAFNLDDTAGKRLKAEVNARDKRKP
jgi:hypothetical protein